MDVEFPFGKNVVCPICGQEHETEMEESYDQTSGDESIWWWVTKKVDPQVDESQRRNK